MKTCAQHETEVAIAREVDAVLQRHPDCDLAERIRKELRRRSDSNTATRLKRIAALPALTTWARDHLAETFDDDPCNAMPALDALNAFREHEPTAGRTMGRPTFYARLRELGFDVRPFDGSGRAGQGVMRIVGVELVP